MAENNSFWKGITLGALATIAFAVIFSTYQEYRDRQVLDRYLTEVSEATNPISLKNLDRHIEVLKRQQRN